MQIKSIKLQNGGFKGIVVEYTESNPREGRDVIKTSKDTIRHPIHLGLEKPFKDLRFHLLEICNIVRGDMDKKDIDYTILESEITGIKIDGDGFSILGTKEAFAGKRFKIETPLVTDEDGYEHYESVIALVATIVEETKVYMKGDAKVTDNELVERWVRAGKEKGFDYDSFAALPPEERGELCTRVLEVQFGKSVLGGDDFTIEHVSTQEVIEQFKQEINANDNVIEIVLSPAAEKIKK